MRGIPGTNAVTVFILHWGFPSCVNNLGEIFAHTVDVERSRSRTLASIMSSDPADENDDDDSYHGDGNDGNHDKQPPVSLRQRDAATVDCTAGAI